MNFRQLLKIFSEIWCQNINCMSNLNSRNSTEKTFCSNPFHECLIGSRSWICCSAQHSERLHVLRTIPIQLVQCSREYCFTESSPVIAKNGLATEGSSGFIAFASFFYFCFSTSLWFRYGSWLPDLSLVSNFCYAFGSNLFHRRWKLFFFF